MRRGLGLRVACARSALLLRCRLHQLGMVVRIVGMAVKMTVGVVVGIAVPT